MASATASLALTGPTRLLKAVKLKKDLAELEENFKKFYQALDLLKNYQILNATAVVKILKKHDKVSKNCLLSSSALPVIQRRHFMISKIVDDMVQMIGKVCWVYLLGMFSVLGACAGCCVH